MGSLTNALRRLTIGLDRIAGWVILPVVFAVIMVDVVLRYVFNDPLIWGLEFSRYFLIALFFFALPECTRTHGHIRMELVYIAMPNWLKNGVTVVYCLAGIVIFYLLAAVEYEELLYSFRLQRATEYLALPLWTFNVVKLAIAGVLIALFALRAVGVLMGNDPYPETSRDELTLED